MKNKNLSLWRNLAYSLIIFGKVKTTYARAKLVIPLIDRAVSLLKKEGKEKHVLKLLPKLEIIKKLKENYLPKFKARKSGFTRIIKLGKRTGDSALMVKLEWVLGTEVGSGKLEAGNKGEKTDAKTNKTKRD